MCFKNKIECQIRFWKRALNGGVSEEAAEKMREMVSSYELSLEDLQAVAYRVSLMKAAGDFERAPTQKVLEAAIQHVLYRGSEQDVLFG